MKTICLSAGHNETDPGACGHGLRESDLTGDICGMVASKLAAYEATVLHVPRYDSLAERAAYANKMGRLDLYLSIPC